MKNAKKNLCISFTGSQVLMLLFKRRRVQFRQHRVVYIVVSQH